MRRITFSRGLFAAIGLSAFAMTALSAPSVHASPMGVMAATQNLMNNEHDAAPAAAKPAKTEIMFSALAFNEGVIKAMKLDALPEKNDAANIADIINSKPTASGKAQIFAISPTTIAALKHALSENGSLRDGVPQSGWSVTKVGDKLVKLNSKAYRFDYGSLSIPDITDQQMTLPKDGGLLIVIDQQPDTSPVGDHESYNREWIVALPTGAF